MLFASAAFLFLFLPLALGIYSITPKKFRKHVLVCESALFYIFANLSTPLAVFVLALTVIATVAAGRYIAKTSSKAFFAGMIYLYAVAFFALRIIYEASGRMVLYPLGAAVFLLSAISYLIDIKRGDSPPGSVVDAVLYLTFFPVIAAGPVVKYKNFIKLTENINFGINSFAGGARRFMAGFVSYIVFSAVLTDAYEKVIEVSGYSIFIPFGIIAAVLISLSSFFAIAGWTDMASGISQMFGIDIPRDCDLSPAAYTPSRYFAGIFKGLGSWIDDYIISSPTFKDKERGRAASAAIKIILLALWIRTTTTMLFIAVIIAAAAAVLSLTGVERMLYEKKYLRLPGWILTGTFVMLFWTASTTVSVGAFFSLIGRLTLTAADFMTSYIYITLSGGKYITVFIAALLLVPMFFNGRQAVLRVPRSLRPKVEGVSTIILILLFSFSLIFFMPQFPQYAARVFEYLAF